MLTADALVDHIHRQGPAAIEALRPTLLDLPPADIAEVLNQLTLADAAAILTALPLPRAIEVVDQPTLRRRSAILEELDPALAAQILDGMSADQRTDVSQRLTPHGQRRLLPQLSAPMRAEVEQLLQYPERTAGSLMTTEFVRLAPMMTVGEALQQIRRVAGETETIYACYVLEPATDGLLGAVSLRDLVLADPGTPMTEVMRRQPVTVQVDEDQEAVAHKISKYNLLAVPVLAAEGRIVGVVTVDDVIDVLVEEQTEDLLRVGAVEPGALEQPYLAMPFRTMVQKRATWLVILFVGELLTATAMGFFEAEIARAVVLALFVPLIISSGGNSGSQATTLLIRALALQEVRLQDWGRVLWREVRSGACLGTILGAIGLLRIALWSLVSGIYGPHWGRIGLTVALALVGVVLWGTIAGAMLPFVLKRLGADPAASSAPFVATLVDVTGLVIYFTVALVVLRGTLL
jgi:magnesium transporter